MKVFIISYNRLTPLKNMCEFLAGAGCEPIIIDNASTYQPLLDWFKDCPYDVIRMKENRGHQVAWHNGQMQFTDDRYYIVTDHDLDLSGVPLDFCDKLMKGLELFPQVIKSGLSLEINDLPKNSYTKEVYDWEVKFWQTEKKHGFYLSDIDTTFAMYDRKRNFGHLPNNRFFSAVRADRPYTARHLPWYLEALNEEERYYLEHTTTYWATKFKEHGNGNFQG